MENRRLIIKLVLATAVLILVISLWLRLVVPEIMKIPGDFSYQADVLSIENFYDEAAQKYSGEQRSVTQFSYEVTEEKDGILIIKNIFDVRTLQGEKIIAVERNYGIDPYTGKHVPLYGDHPREGYLFAPSNLKKGQPFTYWHVNYDGPAQMAFVAEEKLFGLKVYHYETDYKGVKIDQTVNLAHLGGVGVTRGVALEPKLEVWIEPTTGRLVKYHDDTFAYYYDLKTGQKISPWNHFSNIYTDDSVFDQVKIAKSEKFKFTFFKIIAPALFALLTLSLFFFEYRNKMADELQS